MAGPGPEGLYERYVTQAKEAARNGNLEESLKFFNLANEIHPSEKLKSRIKRLEETLAELALATEEEEGFVDVCNSGLMIYGEMHNKLFEYQREGVAFLYSLYRDGRQGGILADDMGLGKTIQIIAFLSGMFDAELIQFVLLVMPTTLVSNWMREFANWTPGLRVKDFHGTSRTERNRKLERIQRKNGIVITTYQMLINNWQQLSSLSGKEFVWDYIILDEAHKIKSPSAKTTKTVYAIPAKNRILLTGTPVQNNLREMWSLFDFACQGALLGTVKTFKMEYENPITRAREKDATPGEKALGLKISENLMTIIKPYFLRRTKDDIQKKYKYEVKTHLPEDQSKNIAPVMPSLTRKNDFIVWVYLAPVQEEIYRNFLSLDHVKEVLMTTRSPLAELNVLKKLCDHPRLLSARACSQLGLERGGYSEQDDENEGDAFSGANKIDHLSDEILIQESGKLLFLMGLLERLQEEGHRTLVFSQSRKMLDIVERILTHRNFRTMRIDGTVTHLVERERRIGVFQSNKDYSVFLLTTQVGGVGITLTAASRVVIFDPSWNPATDAQAVDRAYRIGQKENVVIYRLITCGTVEEKIYRRQVFKDSLIRQTTGDKKNPFRYFTKQELRELFTLGDTRTSATQIQLQSLHATQRKTDLELDEHIAYLHSLEMFGISDHDLMYTREIAQEEQAENEDAHQYIKQRVQKAQELVQLESQLKDQLMGRIRSDTEGAWLRQPVSSSQSKKKSPEFNTNHFISSLVSVEPSNDEAVDLTEDEDVANVSARMTSLVIVDSGEEKPAQDVSNMDVNELLTSSKVLKQSNIHEAEQKLDPNFIPSSLGVHSFANKESHSHESRRHSHFSHSINNAQITSSLFSQPSFNGSVIADPKRYRNAEMSLQTHDPLTNPEDDGNENPQIASPVASKSLLNVMSEFPSGLQKSHVNEASLETTSVASSQYQADFNLVLEDSEDGQQDVSKRGKLLEYTENTGFHLQVGNCGSSAMNSWVREHDDFGNSCNVAMDNLNDSIPVSEALRESGDDMPIGKKKRARRIVSDSEDEDNSVMILDENLLEKKFSPLNSPLCPSLMGITSSTPKCDKSMVDSIFSPRGNRSTASRRSLINVVLDQVEDIEETVGAFSQTQDSDEVQELLMVEEAEEHSVESVEPEEEPVGETLDTEGTASYLDDTESVVSEADEIEEEPQEESTGDPELLSGEQMDCFSKESAGQKDDQTIVDSLHTSDNYDALIECGKKLKDNGKLQDALNCFLQALDIKNGDPEVMLITLNLYKQLSQK
ncbi:DNA excision repair protein ERCC-6-like [Gopherus flavomarginatus]|uniref:DNA excision repair protein ERCC-6-like n=1 Tax=Gopherus flavomarginatus TaxID=286002 RepID=UPI0021CC1290|nr:DNA excision repair protein ERCC-6-like [Gopherus flavomarginatus]